MSTKHAPGHKSGFQVPPYFFESNADLVRRLEFDDGDMVEISHEIDFREEVGEWLTIEQHRAAIATAKGQS